MWNIFIRQLACSVFIYVIHKVYGDVRQEELIIKNYTISNSQRTNFIQGSTSLGVDAVYLIACMQYIYCT